MKIQCNILWIDDAPDWVESVKAGLNAYDDDHHELKFHIMEDGDNFSKVLSSRSIDLIILDHNLPNRNGDELIREARNLGETTDIIFYSQNDQSNNVVCNWGGVLFTPRDDASGYIEAALSDFKKRISNISLMRGMIIAEAIDFENKVTELLKKMFGNKANLFTRHILDKPYLDFSKKCNMLTGFLKDLLDGDSVSDVDRPRVDLMYSTSIQMQAEIVDQRNILAHSVRKIDEEGSLVLQGINQRTKNIVFDHTWKFNIRVNIAKHRLNLMAIEEYCIENNHF